MRRFLMLAAAIAVASSVGCANARYIQKLGDEGVVAVPVNSDAWPCYNRTSAMKLIEDHVGPNFEIIEEREVTTGIATTNTQNTSREQTVNSQIPSLPAERQTTTTTTTAADMTEYQIHYRKRIGGATGFPGTKPLTTVTPAGSTASTGGVVPAVHTQPQTTMTSPSTPMPSTTTPAGPLPPPDLSSIGTR